MTEDPLSTVVVGSGICLERFDDYNSVLKLSPKPKKILNMAIKEQEITLFTLFLYGFHFL